MKKHIIEAYDRSGQLIAIPAVDLPLQAGCLRITDASPIQNPSPGYGNGKEGSPFNVVGVVHLVDEPNGMYDQSNPDSSNAIRIQLGRIIDRFENGKPVGPVRIIPTLLNGTNRRSGNGVFISPIYGEHICRMWSEAHNRDYKAEKENAAKSQEETYRRNFGQVIE